MGSIILPPGTAPASPTEGELYYDNTAKQVKFRDNAGFKALGTADLQGEPHIITKKLFPAYLGKLLDDTTSHSGDYGTEQADGRMYYYTEIAGSKPIHDPRIGAHFGSQRHKFKSLQILEQETATHGVDVASVDGREWIRTSGKIGGSSDPVYYRYDAHGTSIMLYRNGTGFFEITGYFNDVNFLNYTAANRGIQYYLDGGSANGTHLGTASVGTPLNSRYVDTGSLVNLGLSTNLGIHTIKIKSSTSDDTIIYGIELIAQDTSNRNNIQIPSQNVVSYGKKFNVSAEGSSGHHYNPFNGYTATSSFSSVVDVDTSLGLEAWKHTDNNYYPPVNGGRIVKWVDSSGTIKTSVTLMPPNATGIGSFSSNPRDPNYGSWSSQYQPTFKNETERQLHEVAKTYYARDFGNGGANHDPAPYKDATSMNVDSNATHDIAYVMDDGLTSISANDVTHHGGGSQNPKVALGPASGTQYIYITFIGTGFSWTDADGTINNTAQNLPYGTHIAKINRSDYSISIDGVSIHTVSSGDTFALLEVSFFQPKKPPIPEDACILSDFMLMADYVPQTSGTAPFISKGVRRNNGSRDLFYDTSTGGTYFSLNVGHSGGFQIGASASQSADVFQANLPAFATRIDSVGYGDRRQIFVDGGSAETQTVNGSAQDAVAKMSNAQTLGLYTFKSKNKASTDGTVSAIDVATPIHTSHHYQPFETPFLHELVGGDRNMEQHNLVCSPDGKTWDQITRDTSYIGKCVLFARADDTYTGDADVNIIDDWRGTEAAKQFFNKKHFAIAYDRMICLEDGEYLLYKQTYHSDQGDRDWDVNEAAIARAYQVDGGSIAIATIVKLKRGDFVQSIGRQTANDHTNFIWIEKK